MENEITKTKISKKIVLIIFLLFMLFLNIFDFLNLLPADLDFIEKILSWTLFGYIFYEASLTKIFIGTRKKIYDLIYIFAFSLIAITKSIIYYAKDGSFIPQDYTFFIFEWILKNLRNLNSSEATTYAFFLGLIIIIINSIILLRKNNIEEKSLLGSINFNEFAKFLKLHYITLILISIFFAMIIFNFFMEWFALAIDDFIPIIGLFYYLFKYIHMHTENKISSYLNDVNNSGQNFFENVIEFFSNKKTLLIGISFLLTLHLVVDAGVYIFPYITGVENGLYFENLNTKDKDHSPLLNFYEKENSHLYNDLSQDFILNFSIILIYLVTIITFFSLLILPFYVYYKNIQKQETKINNIFGTIFLAGLIFLPIVFLLPNTNLPLNIGVTSEESNILGVDIHTKNVFEEELTSKASLELLTTTILFLVIIGFLIFRYEKYKFFFDKLIFIIAISFFMLYITIFFLSIIKSEFNYIQNDFKSPKLSDTSANYTKISQIYSNPIYYIDQRGKTENTIKGTTITYTQTPFTTLEKVNRNYVNYSIDKNYTDYLYIIIKNPNNEKIVIEDISKAYFKEPQYIKQNILYTNEKEIELIYEFGNKLIIEETKNGYTSKAKNNINIIKKKSYIETTMTNIIEYIKFIFLAIFYVFGGVEFAIYFTRKNILHTT